MLTPGQNPSDGEDNPENILYSRWYENPESRMEIELLMLPSLRRHAIKVCWMVLHSYDPQIVESICSDALMSLDSFEGRSQFSTWFHGFALNVLRAEYRRRNRRKEISLDAVIVRPLLSFNVNPEQSFSVREFVNRLHADERELVQLKVFDGHSDAEIAELLSLSREAVTRDWIKLRRKMRVLYAGKVA